MTLQVVDVSVDALAQHTGAKPLTTRRNEHVCSLETTQGLQESIFYYVQ